jgi:hypothetical protein
MTLSWSKLYNNNDEAEFDRVLPGTSEAGKSANKEASTEIPNIRTRETYTENDLKKFNKMFSDGHAPAVARTSNSKVSPARETSSSRNRTGDYSTQDQALFKKINPSSKVSGFAYFVDQQRSGRIGNQTSGTEKNKNALLRLVQTMTEK